jgi:hypothetical protein
VAEGGGLLNRYTVNSRIVGSNPIPSATINATRDSFRRCRWTSIEDLAHSAHFYASIASASRATWSLLSLRTIVPN